MVAIRRNHHGFAKTFPIPTQANSMLLIALQLTIYRV